LKKGVKKARLGKLQKDAQKTTKRGMIRLSNEPTSAKKKKKKKRRNQKHRTENGRGKTSQNRSGNKGKVRNRGAGQKED